ncbi:MAG TPA: hypothetical protein VHB20_08495 [Verrucomicrobiae bacterium]|nr:hypothetical protein [Verrucomicrobiae bacterium]
MSDGAKQEVTYDAVYRQRLDEKRRVPVPHRWRSGKSEDFHLVIWQQHQAGTCLRVLTPARMTKLRQKLDEMPDGAAKGVLKRRIGSLSVTVSVDNAGRIAIPQDMTAAADITNDAVFVGMLDRFEIWSPERYAKVEALDNAVMAEAMRLME